MVELRVAGRRSGAYRRVLLTLLQDGEQWFLAHPNGDVAWTRNLEAAGTADIAFRRLLPVPVRARRLEPGDLRDRAIRSTGQAANLQCVAPPFRAHKNSMRGDPDTARLPQSVDQVLREWQTTRFAHQ